MPGLCSRIARYLGALIHSAQRPGSHPGPLARLPPEIMALILAQLPGASRACLALTCRALYAQHGHFLFAPHNPYAKAALLPLLERDWPGFWFCHFCVVLHPWQTRRVRGGGRGRGAWVGVARSKCRLRGRTVPGIVIVGGGGGLEYPQARIYMNGRLYGPAHGPPLPPAAVVTTTRMVSGQGSRFGTGTGTSVRRSWEARFVNDELYVSSTTTLSSAGGERGDKALRTFIDDGLAAIICHHVTARGGRNTEERLSRYYVPDLDLDLDCDRDTDDGPACLQPVEGPLRACRRCLTDFVVSVRRRAATWLRQEGWVVEVRKWQRLGRCRSPYDEAWRRHVGNVVLGTPRRSAPAGMVRYEWGQSQGLEWEVEGSFLEDVRI